jgi:hypothetical protein
VVASSDLRRGEFERGPGRGVEERGNNHGFPVHKSQAKFTVAKVLEEDQRRRWNDEATEGATLRAG